MYVHIILLIICMHVHTDRHACVCAYMCVLSGELCALLWPPLPPPPGAGAGDGEEERDSNWCHKCQCALNGLSEAFNHSMQAYTQGEHEQYRERELPPHAHAHNGHHVPQRNLAVPTGRGGGRGFTTNLIKSKGMSKVSMCIVFVCCVLWCVLCTYVRMCFVFVCYEVRI